MGLTSDNKKTLPGEVTISRVHSSTEDDFIQIEIVDGNSHSSFVVAKLSVKQFGDLLSGRANVDAELTIRGLNVVGKFIKSVEHIIKVDESYPYNLSHADKVHILKSWIDEGYRPRWGDLRNSHRIVERADTYTSYRVVFWYYVDDPESEVPVIV